VKSFLGGRFVSNVSVEVDSSANENWKSTDE